jgi:hypothetical protein
MYVTYGSTNLSTLGGLTGTSQVSSYRRRYQNNQRGGPDTITAACKVSGTICLLQGTSYTTAQAQTAIDAAVFALQTAIAFPGLALSFRTDAGVATNLSLPTDISLGGVQISDLDIPADQPADYASGLDWSFNVEALYSDPNADELLSYQESVEISGGAARTEWVEVIDGDPVEWTLASVTVGTLIQSGTMTGRTGHLVLPPALYPTYYKPNLSNAGVVRPQYRNGVPFAYTRSWRYVHQKPGPWDLPELGAI